MQAARSFAYQNIAKELSGEISRGAFAGGRLPPERELSTRFGVNRLTLRKALDILAGQGIIVKMGARGTFVRQADRSDGLAGKVVAFVLAGRREFDEFHSQTIVQLERAAARARANTMIFCLEKNRITRLADAADRGMIHAMVVSGLVTPLLLRRLVDLGLPLVMLGSTQFASPVEETVTRVLVDAVAYGREATGHLLGLGHERIAFINGPPFTWFAHAEQGYAGALLDAGRQFRERLVERCDDDSIEQGALAMRRLLSRVSPTAVFAANDRLACGAMRELSRRGMVIPREMSVIGVGDHLRGREMLPPLTTIAVSTTELADAAIENLRLRHSGTNARHELPEQPRTIYVSFRLVRRGTCSSPGKEIKKYVRPKQRKEKHVRKSA